MSPTESQKRAIDCRDGDLLVSAAAGSGKTRVLTSRLIAYILEDGRHIDDFAVITYTTAAAAELRGKIAQSLAEQAFDKRAERELNRLHLARIGTIHSFCGALIRRFAVECDVPASFAQLEQYEAEELKRQALSAALERLYAGENEDFLRFSEIFSAAGRDFRLEEIILSLFETTRALPDPDEFFRETLRIMEQNRDFPHSRAFEFIKSEIFRALDFWSAITDLSLREAKKEDAAHPYIAALNADAALADYLRGRFAEGWDAFAEATDGLKLTPLSRAKKDAYDESTIERIKARREQIKRIIGDFSERYGKNLNEIGDENLASAVVARGLSLAVSTLADEYAALKRAANALDFNDLERVAFNLLQNPETAAAVAAQTLEVMIDEYQDVNRLQEGIVQALKSAGSRVFMVGDFRQSIYGFRHADPSLFIEKYHSLSHVIELSENFRSEPGILAAVNEVFAPIMTAETHGHGYGAPLKAGNKSESVPAAFFHLAGEDESEAEIVASIAAREVFINGVAQNEVAVLLRSTKRERDYAAALKRAGLSVCAHAENLLDSPSVMTLYALFRVLDNPLRELDALTLLRSPAYEFSPDEILSLRLLGGGFMAAAERSNPRVAGDLRFFRALALDSSGDKIAFAAMNRLKLGAAVTALLPALSACFTPAECVRTIERANSGAVSDGGGGVKIMTVHASKGLEFSCVILPETGKKINLTDAAKPILFHRDLGLGLLNPDPETRTFRRTLLRGAVADKINYDARAEETRVLYVALTRAKNRLFVIGKGGKERENLPIPYNIMRAGSMLDWLNMTIKLDSGNWTFPGKIEPPPLPPKPEAEPAEEKPGEDFSPPKVRKFSDLPSKVTATELKRAEEYLDAEPIPSLERPPRPFARPRFIDKNTELTPAQKGTAAHLAIQSVDLHKCEDLQGALSEIDRLRRLKILSEEQARAVDHIQLTRFVNSPLGRRVSASGNVLRETPFSLLTDYGELYPVKLAPQGKALVQGVIDLCFEEDGEWVVVDFKTGFPKNFALAAEGYRTQIELYVSALERVTRKSVKEGTVYFLGLGKSVTLVCRRNTCPGSPP